MIEKRLYKTVSSYSSETIDYTVGSSKTLAILEMGGDAVFDRDIKVEIIWDATGTPEKIFATHGSTLQKSLLELSGDGTKKIRIKLTNDSSSSETIGGFWIGQEY